MKVLLRIAESIKNNDTLQKRTLYNRVLLKLNYFNIVVQQNESDDELACKIIKFVGEYLGLRNDYYYLKSRKREVVQGRQIAITIIKSNTKLSLAFIGSYFGKGHATILHSHKTIDDLYQTDKNLKIIFITILKRLNLKYETRNKIPVDIYLDPIR